MWRIVRSKFNPQKRTRKKESPKIIKILDSLETFDGQIENIELESKAGCTFQSHLLSKSTNSNLILWPHGGPNSCITIDFVPLFTAMV